MALGLVLTGVRAAGVRLYLEGGVRDVKLRVLNNVMDLTLS